MFEVGPAELEVFAVLFVSLLFDILSCFLSPESLVATCFLLHLTQLRLSFTWPALSKSPVVFPASCYSGPRHVKCWSSDILHEEDLMPYKTNNIKIIYL